MNESPLQEMDVEGILGHAQEMLPSALAMARVDPSLREEVAPEILESVWRSFVPFARREGLVDGELSSRLIDSMIEFAKLRSASVARLRAGRDRKCRAYALRPVSERPRRPSYSVDEERFLSKLVSSIGKSGRARRLARGTPEIVEKAIKILILFRRAAGDGFFRNRRAAGWSAIRLLMEIVDGLSA